jgi:hypothetical protein
MSDAAFLQPMQRSELEKVAWKKIPQMRKWCAESVNIYVGFVIGMFYSDTCPVTTFLAD